jgi:hypothetical protein
MHNHSSYRPWLVATFIDHYSFIATGVDDIIMHVAKGYSQVECLDFDKTFALVAKLESIHMLLDYATHHGFKLYQMDIKSAFLNDLIKEVSVEQPPEFESE